MVANWMLSIDKRPSDRTGQDLDAIYSRLKSVKAFEKFHPLLLQQICYYGYYEDLEKGIVLFRQGDIGTNWYAVLSGLLEVQVSETGYAKDAITLCTLGPGTAFGESILNNTPHHATVVTSEYCELLRVEQKDFKLIWEKNQQLLEGTFNPSLSTLSYMDMTYDRVSDPNKPSATQQEAGSESSNPAAPITTSSSPRISKAGVCLRTYLLTHCPSMIRDRKHHLRTYRRCMVGKEMVDWMIQQWSGPATRAQIIGMWQTLVEEGVIVHVCHEHPFKDSELFYRFYEDDQGVGTVPTTAMKRDSEEALQETLVLLAQQGSDALMRMILRKRSEDRTVEDLGIVYEELVHIKALSHLSKMVKRELASVLMFEAHNRAGTVLFNQGDEGTSWYIILKGSVNVVIYGKGVVCTLHEGDDFGKLALVNDSPRAATIVLREDVCHFLKVHKEDFNRILRDVEANTVRLKEHGQDVLVLEKIPSGKVPGSGGATQIHYKYSVMAGTPQKMLEYLLETRMDNKHEDASDTFLEDFVLTHIIFMPTNHLCPALVMHYHAEAGNNAHQMEKESTDFTLMNKRRVIRFVHEWYNIIRDALFEDTTFNAFLEEFVHAVQDDCDYVQSLKEEAALMHEIVNKQKAYKMGKTETEKNGKLTVNPDLRKISAPCLSTQPRAMVTRPSLPPFKQDRNLLQEDIQLKPVKPNHDSIFKVFCADHTYTTLKLKVKSTVSEVLSQAADKLCLGKDLVLCEVKSNGDRVVFKDHDLCILPGLSINGRLFIAPREHLDAMTPLPEQDGPTEPSSAMFLEVWSSKDVAQQLTKYDWELLRCMHELEMIYLVFGRGSFKKITANLDRLLRRFNETQFWVISELCLTQPVGKRVQLLKKFIKLAEYCKEVKNLNAFFAIVMGLSNIAVSRLSQTWEKLPNKLKKLFSEFESLMDPSRNHRAYRLYVSKLQPPIIPFMPLLMKDLTFTHEGNKSDFDGLVNFEKMHMVAQTLRTIRYCRSQPLDYEMTGKNVHEILKYISNFNVIDNQRILTQLSQRLEPRRS